MKYDGTVVGRVARPRNSSTAWCRRFRRVPRRRGEAEYLGGIYYFLEKRKLESPGRSERREAPQKPAAPCRQPPNPGAAVSGKLTWNEQRKEQEKQLRKLRRAVEGIEAELAAIENRSPYDAKFAAATTYDEADYKAYNDPKARYDHLRCNEWEKASYEPSE